METKDYAIDRRPELALLTARIDERTAKKVALKAQIATLMISLEESWRAA